MYKENLNFGNILNVVKSLIQIERLRNIPYVTYLLPKIQQFQ